MFDPYRMIVINTVFSLILLISIAYYRFIYPKKTVNLFILLILISLLPLISILRKGPYESGDFSIHVKIAMSFYQNLQDGNFIPQWNNMTCFGYGSALFNFFYLLPYYIISFFHLLNFPFITSVKLLLFFSFIFSGIAMFLFMKQNFGKKSAFAASIIYLFTPYHLINMHFRVDIAETLSFVFLPLIFLATTKIINNDKNKIWFFIQEFLIFLLIITHQVISLAIFPFVIFYGIFLWFMNKKKKIKTILIYFLSLILGLLVSGFFWIPVLFEKKYIFWGNNATINFPKISEFFYSPWRYGLLFQGPKGELSFLLGYIQWFIIFIAIFLIFKNKFKEKKLLLFFLSSFIFIFIMMQSLSKPFWEFIPLIKNFQFSYRLLTLEVFFISVITGIVVKKINKTWFVAIICFLAILSTILNWGNRGVIPEINDNYLKSEALRGDTGLDMGDLTQPKWVNQKILLIKKPAKSPIEILVGEANILNSKKYITKHEYKIQVKKNTLFKENTFYFPGWKLKVNGKDYPFNFENQQYPGIITFNLNQGDYDIELIFTATNIRIITRILSLITLFSSLIYFLIFRRRFPKL